MLDVIVVGARCAGAPLAMLLARRGLRVLLLDRDRFPSDMRMSTHAVHARGVACLRRWKIPGLEALLERCKPIGGALLDVGPFGIRPQFPAVEGRSETYAPRRIDLDQLLVQAAVTAGAELRERSKVEALLVEDGRVTGVRGTTGGRSTFEERGRIVIGADGPSSTVARFVGAEEYACRPVLQGTVWSYWDDVPFDGRLEFYPRAFEAVYAFPTSDGQVVAGVNWAADRFRDARKTPEASFFDVIGRVAPDLADRIRAGSRSEDWRLGTTRNFFRKPFGPGWALTGDAGYKKDPCTAQGITDAFVDTDPLVDAIEDGLSGRRPLEAALSDFHAARDRQAMPHFEFTCQLATFEPPPPDMVALYEALRERPDDASAFAGMITTAVSPAEFMSPENIGRILSP